MDPEELFYLIEKAIEAVGRVGYVEFRIPLKGEQVRQVGHETPIGGADLLVRVVPVLSIAFERPLLQKHFPLFVPFGE